MPRNNSTTIGLPELVKLLEKQNTSFDKFAERINAVLESLTGSSSSSSGLSSGNSSDSAQKEQMLRSYTRKDLINSTAKIAILSSSLDREKETIQTLTPEISDLVDGISKLKKEIKAERLRVKGTPEEQEVELPGGKIDRLYEELVKQTNIKREKETILKTATQEKTRLEFDKSSLEKETKQRSAFLKEITKLDSRIEALNQGLLKRINQEKEQKSRILDLEKFLKDREKLRYTNAAEEALEPVTSERGGSLGEILGSLAVAGIYKLKAAARGEKKEEPKTQKETLSSLEEEAKREDLTPREVQDLQRKIADLKAQLEKKDTSKTKQKIEELKLKKEIRIQKESQNEPAQTNSVPTSKPTPTPAAAATPTNAEGEAETKPSKIQDETLEQQKKESTELEDIDKTVVKQEQKLESTPTLTNLDVTLIDVSEDALKNLQDMITDAVNDSDASDGGGGGGLINLLGGSRLGKFLGIGSKVAPAVEGAAGAAGAAGAVGEAAGALGVVGEAAGGLALGSVAVPAAVLAGAGYLGYKGISAGTEENTRKNLGLGKDQKVGILDRLESSGLGVLSGLTLGMVDAKTIHDKGKEFQKFLGMNDGETEKPSTTTPVKEKTEQLGMNGGETEKPSTTTPVKKKTEQQFQGQMIAGEPVVPGQDLSKKQMVAITMSTGMGNKYSPEIMDQYNKQMTAARSTTPTPEGVTPTTNGTKLTGNAVQNDELKTPISQPSPTIINNTTNNSGGGSDRSVTNPTDGGRTKIENPYNPFLRRMDNYYSVG
jgi:hypothetical protein